MKRRQFWQITLASAAGIIGCQQSRRLDLGDRPTEKTNSLSIPVRPSVIPTEVKVIVDWSSAIAQTTPLMFGSNDYEIIYPERAADSKFQSLLSELNIPLIRIHHAELSEQWTDHTRQTWDENKIKAGYDASYSYRPQIVQNIPRWPSWMAQDSSGLLSAEEYDRYANFCAELVNILNHKQNRNVLYWEPLNELDQTYQEAGKLEQLWQIYNRAAIAMKRADGRIKIGGPVLTWDNSEILESFLSKCHQNVDFISWHSYASGDASDPTEKIMAFTEKYGEQTRRFRSLVGKYLPQRQIPLFLSEYNINYTWDSGENRQNTYLGAVWFASVLKHLADAQIDMAAFWHLKDGIYGAIDPDNRLRASALLFSWAANYLTGTVVKTQSDRPWLETMAIQQQNHHHSLLLINKSAEAARVSLIGANAYFARGKTTTHSININGVRVFSTPDNVNLKGLDLKPYSLLLLRTVSN
ncbi:MAG: alpha-L-arabinofuranosidase [Pleurocapsa sp.]